MNTKKKTGRILSILLSFMLVVGLMPAVSMTAFAEGTRTQVTLVEGTSPDFTPVFGKSIDSIRPEVTVTTGSPAHFEQDYWGKYDEATGQYNRVESGSFTAGKWRYFGKIRIDGEGNDTHALADGVVVKINGVTWNNIQNVHGLDHGEFTLQYVMSPVFEVDPSNSQVIIFNADNTDLCNYLVVGTSIGSVKLSGSVEGGTAPYTFEKISGPKWIDISSSGVVSGTPTAADVGYSKDLVFRITDQNGTTAQGRLKVPYVHNIRTVIDFVEGKSPDYTPAYGKTVESVQPQITITKGAPASIRTNYWQKYNEEKGIWENVKTGVFTDGKWQYSAVVVVEGEANETHMLTKETKVKINGQSWEVFPKSYLYDDKSLLYIYSPVIEIELPESLTGDAALSKAYYSDPVNPVLSDNLQTMNKNGKLSFQWQRSSDGTSSWKDISGATNAAYYPGTGDVGKYIRVVITADGYISSGISNGIEVKQALINFTKPVKPTLSYSTSNGLVVTNAKANQEYLVTYSNKEPSSWSSAVKPSADGTLKLNAGGNTVAYVHTRVAETAYRPAGMYTDYSTIYTGTAVNLVSFELNYSKVSVKAGKCVKLTATPVPAGATTWKTDPGVQWYVNSSNAKLYKDAACTQEYDRSSDGYCESVYLKGINQSSWITVGAERTISGGIPTTGQMYVAVTDADGNYVLERLALPDVTLAPGESATVDISSYPDPSKIDGKMTFEAYSSNPGSKLTLTPLENNTKLRIDVPADAKTGSYGYDVKLDGTSINKNVWTISVAEKSVPVESVSVTPATVTLAPGSSLNLNAVVSPSNATENKTVTWSRSSGSSKISVDSKGKVTVAADAPEGVTAVIKAEAGGKSATCTVKVAVPEYEILTIDGKAYSEGKTVTAAKAGTIGNLVANDAPSGKVFDKWEVVTGDVAIADLNSASTAFVMPNDNVMVKAAYKDSSLSDYKSASIRLSTTKYTYNGSVKKPTVKVVDAEGNTIPSGDYTVSYASGRKNVGRYKVTVTFKDASKKYTYFYINPKGTSISKVSGAKKAFTVKWKKQSSKMAVSTITGYQIRYSTSSKMTNARTKTVKGYKSTSKKITGLSAGKKYYVQVRTYKTVNGKTYYSSWSSVKSVKTK